MVLVQDISYPQKLTQEQNCIFTELINKFQITTKFSTTIYTETTNYNKVILYLSILLQVYSCHTEYIQPTMQQFRILLPLKISFGRKRPSSGASTTPKLSHCIKFYKCENTCIVD
jgi:hypothetical protein